MIFLDTGAFVARFIQRDQFHQQAMSCWKILEAEKATIYTSNFVLDETMTLLGRWADYSFASKIAKNLYHSSPLVILRPGREDELDALRLFEKHSDQKVSFTDCISCVLMRKNSLTQIFTFDHHFSLWKFKTLPEKGHSPRT